MLFANDTLACGIIVLQFYSIYNIYQDDNIDNKKTLDFYDNIPASRIMLEFQNVVIHCATDGGVLFQ